MQRQRGHWSDCQALCRQRGSRCSLSEGNSLTARRCAGREAADAVRALQEACSCSIALYAFGIGRSIDESELRKIVDVCQPGSADSCYLTLYGKDDGYPFEGL